MSEKKTPRIFTTLPSAVIGDTSLTALDIRCLAVISLHDGMSGVKRSGGGCYARNDTLAKLARTDATNFSKSLTKLIRAGYVAREPQVMDKRRSTLRVLYPEDNSWRDDQVSPPEIVGEDADPNPEVVGDGYSENGSFSRQTEEHYISLNEEIDFVETRKGNSTKWPLSGNSSLPWQRNPAKAGLGRVSLKAQMSPKFDSMDSAAQVGQIQRAFATMGYDASQMSRQERDEIASLLYNIHDCYADQPFGQQAHRLYEAITVC